MGPTGGQRLAREAALKQSRPAPDLTLDDRHQPRRRCHLPTHTPPVAPGGVLTHTNLVRRSAGAKPYRGASSIAVISE